MLPIGITKLFHVWCGMVGYNVMYGWPNKLYKSEYNQYSAFLVADVSVWQNMSSCVPSAHVWRWLFSVSNITDFFGNAIVCSFGGYFVSSMLARENKTDDISDWYGTCC